jgi:hypothetical protein
MRIFLFIYFATASILLGQDTDYNNRLHMISDRSYIQLMRGNIPSRNQNTSETTKTTFMEAQIAPFYFIRFGENSKVALAVSPKIIIRMADAESLPIKTPSFMPTITAFHKVNLTSLSKNKITNWLITPNHHTYLIYRLHITAMDKKMSFLYRELEESTLPPETFPRIMLKSDFSGMT